jgi:hypothetical protein
MTDRFVLTPPCAFINANGRLHHYKRNELTQTWRRLTAETVNAGWHPFHYTKAHITVIYRFATNHRREVSNLQPTSKAIVDDDDLHVIGPDNRREWPNGEPRVTVEIREAA